MGYADLALPCFPSFFSRKSPPRDLVITGKKMAGSAAAPLILLGAYYYTWCPRPPLTSLFHLASHRHYVPAELRFRTDTASRRTCRYGVGEQWEVFPRPWEPTLGEYRSADSEVIQKHHAWAKSAGLDFLAVSWGGDGTRAPKVTALDPQARPRHRRAATLMPRPCVQRGDNAGVSGSCRLSDTAGRHHRPDCGGVELQRGAEYRVEGWTQPVQWWTPSVRAPPLDFGSCMTASTCGAEGGVGRRTWT